MNKSGVKNYLYLCVWIRKKIVVEFFFFFFENNFQLVKDLFEHSEKLLNVTFPAYSTR